MHLWTTVIPGVLTLALLSDCRNTLHGNVRTVFAGAYFYRGNGSIKICWLRLNDLDVIFHSFCELKGHSFHLHVLGWQLISLRDVSKCGWIEISAWLETVQLGITKYTTEVQCLSLFMLESAFHWFVTFTLIPTLSDVCVYMHTNSCTMCKRQLLVHCAHVANAVGSVFKILIQQTCNKL